jgi:23S rRNA A2030 N6-methylase RlmJ
MTYDHRKKAGNAFDIVKHAALLAALDTVLSAETGWEFTYADLFAGFARTPLIKGNEWEAGIGAMDASVQQSPNPHAALWGRRYAGKEQLQTGFYPGSAAIAKDLIMRHGKTPELLLWDSSGDAAADLKAAFRESRAGIREHPADPNDPLLRQAGFVFIDPPGVASHRHPDFPEIHTLFAFFETCPASILMWLPLEDNPGRDLGKSAWPPAVRQQIDRLELFEMQIQWVSSGGCGLIGRLSPSAAEALKAAVHAILGVLPPLRHAARIRTPEARASTLTG